MSRASSSSSPTASAATTTTTYLSTGDLAANLGRGSWVVLDVRWIHGDPLKGRADFLESHIEGAVFVHLVEDATGEVVPGVTGRNPLPSLEKANKVFSRAGINPGSTVVVYDSMGGAFAGRVWWILKWLQHDGPVYLLEGGFKKWSREGLPTSSGDEPPKALGSFVGRPCAEMCVGAEEVIAALKEPESWKLIDTRPAERFTGQSEPVDPVAGHIPGFINVPFQQNINTTTGMPLTREELRAKYEVVFGGVPVDRVIMSCSAGIVVGLCVLSVVHSGLGMPKMYPGSWSDWITDPSRPTVTLLPPKEP